MGRVVKRLLLAIAVAVVLTFALIVALTGCAPARTAVPTFDPVQPAPTVDIPIGATSGSCRAGQRDGQPLPDATCTPGAFNPAVTQANIGSTICQKGWTATVRPPLAVTDKIKVERMSAYGIPPGTTAELDHLVPLELGGAPADIKNLWPQVGKIPNPKDAVENALNHAVCAGLVPLNTARIAIAGNWVTAFDTAGLRVAGGQVCLRSNPSRCVAAGRG